MGIGIGDRVVVDARLFGVRRRPRSLGAIGTVVEVNAGGKLRVEFGDGIRRTVHVSRATRIWGRSKGIGGTDDQEEESKVQEA